LFLVYYNSAVSCWISLAASYKYLTDSLGCVNLILAPSNQARAWQRSRSSKAKPEELEVPKAEGKVGGGQGAGVAEAKRVRLLGAFFLFAEPLPAGMFAGALSFQC